MTECLRRAGGLAHHIATASRYYVYGGMRGRRPGGILRRAGYDVFEWHNRPLGGIPGLHTPAHFLPQG